MDIKIEYENFVTPFLERVLQDKPRWMASALKSTGWWAQQEIKKGIKSGAPGGQKYADFTPSDLRGKLRPWANKKADKINPWAQKIHDGRYKDSPLGWLIQAVGYDKRDANKGVVPVGWLSKTAIWLGSKHEKGFSTETTQQMRRKFNAVGLKLSGKKIVTPARPTFGPMKPIIEAGAPSHFQIKIMGYIVGALERSKASSRRKYKVYK